MNDDFDPITIFFRFLFGAITALAPVLLFAVYGLMPLWLGVTTPLVIGALTVVYGDRFLVEFCQLLRVIKWW
jgi:hypothetical protein